jgi:hypothetical protein
MLKRSGPSRAVPHRFRDVKYFRACIVSPFEAASRPACATAEANCFHELSCDIISPDFACRSADGRALNWSSVRLSAEPDANKGRVLQSVSEKRVIAVDLSPCCQAVRAGCATGDAGDGAGLGELAFLPHPANRRETMRIALMLVVFISNAASIVMFPWSCDRRFGAGSCPRWPVRCRWPAASCWECA